MTWKTHILGGVLLAEGVGTVTGMMTPDLMATVAVSGVMALVPDLDQPNSKASRWGINRLVAYPLNKLFGHRGFIHSPLLWLVISGILALCKTPIWLWLGVLLGTFSHLILDTLNPTGIPWLYPYPRHFHLGKIKTNSLGETIVLILLAISCILLLIPVLKGGTLYGNPV